MEEKSAKIAESNDSMHSYGPEGNMSEFDSSCTNTQDYDAECSSDSRTSNQFIYDRNANAMPADGEENYASKHPFDYYDENDKGNQHIAVGNMQQYDDFGHHHAELSGTMHDYNR